MDPCEESALRLTFQTHLLADSTSLMSALLIIAPGDVGSETASLSCTK